MPAALKVADVVFGGEQPLVLIAGPCVMEDETQTLTIARQLAELQRELGVGVVFKASFDKANRTSLSAYRGPGLQEGLRILDKVRQETGLPLLSDVHDVGQVDAAAGVLDILQIPAFLCRQTDLLLAAGRSGKIVNIKKGQFLAPWDMANAVTKVASTGNERILLTERGTSFGYNNLVVDMRSLAIMRETGCPVVFDATHAVQLPGGAGTSSGGQRQYVAALSRAAVAVGVDGLFWEVHPDPDHALCDGANSLPLAEVKAILKEMLAIDAVIKGNTQS
ncbi:MAG: 2-dehydro-3-deoxyphosphooctonate aldolase synthase [Desulfuromonadales bacterium]|nr:2-dehydro-3-deoxyphosphooctonate aldolase synthase [Desulfuromonadales bacterium]